MNPITELLSEYRYAYADLSNVEEQFKLRNEIIELGIPGLVDVQFMEEPRSFRVIPVFATEQDYMWYQLKYNVNSL